MNLPKLVTLVAMFTFVGLGCTSPLKISLLNNAGEDFSVTMPKSKSKTMIEVKNLAVIEYPQSEQNWMVHLITTKCDYEYQLPKTLEHYDWKDSFESTPVIQVERDFQLYLLPRKTTSVAQVSDYLALQLDGFPIGPKSKVCQ